MRFDKPERPLEESEIKKVEKRLGLEFPAALKRHYLRANCGRPDPCVYFGKSVEAVVSECLPLMAKRADETAVQVYDHLVTKLRLLPTQYFPFAVDPGGDYFFVDCSSPKADVVIYHHDTAFEPLVSLGVGLEEFWQKLVPDADLNWEPDDDHSDVCRDIRASTDATSLDAIGAAITSVWPKIGRASGARLKLQPKAKSVKIVAGIWLDSGRIIFEVIAKRELFRIAVKALALEEKYFALPKADDEFDKAYQSLVGEVEQRVVSSIVPGALTQIGFPVEVFTQDSGDVETAKLVFRI